MIHYAQKMPKKQNPPPKNSMMNLYETGKLFEKALHRHQNGDWASAKILYGKVLAIEPGHPDALHLSGVIAYEEKQYDEAESMIGRAISRSPESSLYHYNMGLVMEGKGFPDKALESFLKALAFRPDYGDALYRAGLMYQGSGDYENAIMFYEKALSMKVHEAEIWNNLGNIAQESMRFDEADEFYNRAITLAPGYGEAFSNFGNLCLKTGRIRDAESLFKNAVGLKPGLFEAHTGLGIVFMNGNRLNDAARCFMNALSVNPSCVEAAFRLGMTLTADGKRDDALNWFHRVIELQPDHGGALQGVLSILEYRCDWDSVPKYLTRLRDVSEKAMAEGRNSPEDPFSCIGRHTDTGYIRRVTESWSRGYEAIPDILGVRFDWGREKKDGEKITVGYLSNTFRNHPNAHLVAGLFKRHDRRAFRVNCYSFGPDDGSDYRRRIMDGCDGFLDIRDMGYLEAAAKINADKVDILVDLTGYTLGNRLEIAALRPAPIQVRYLGFPGSMHACFFDYLITDRTVTPPEQQVHYSEKFVCMPQCYQINDAEQVIGPETYVRSDFGLPENGFVFCSFNTSYKIDPVMFDVWMGILKAVPGSVLWLLRQGDLMAKNLRNYAENHGVSGQRLVFADKMPKSSHLSRLRLADLALDTRLVSGHITTSDALWAGVPVITLKGNHFISRSPSSTLVAAGLPDLVTETIDQYRNMAVELARDKRLLEKYRTLLKDNRITSPLFDTGRFVKNYEKALKTMWQLHAGGNPPETIAVIEETEE
jgi:protein O-GlcNAc transferase